MTLALLAAAGCGPSPAGSATGEIAADASQVTYQLKLKITEEGVLKADLMADTAVTPVGETRTQLQGVKLTFFNPGQAPGKLTSKTGEYDQASGLMIARGDVVLLTPGEKGMRTIKSEELHWDQKGDRVWSEKETSIEENGQTLITQGFTSNSRFTQVSGNNAKTGAVQVGEGGIRF
ncbi:MAG TPA: LPS export ABC transporter periplasmic protein LptC [Longimicrobium sp.]|nr:LPS export ABC transporter periplasmic protein LptC [Longimicrobium sp.]